MKLIYAPSGRRMIPYPPVGVALLVGAIKDLSNDEPRIVDLEMSMWEEHATGSSCLLYRGGVDARRVLAGETDSELVEYQMLMAHKAEIAEGEDVGISVMGFEQLASALLLTKMALSLGCRVILGGQFWSEKSVQQVLTGFDDEDLTITIGDGWNALREWKLGHDGVPTNSFALRDGVVQKGPRETATALPPMPSYETVDWDVYRTYCERVLDDRRAVRRAHLYVWDKLCPFKCNFCRVSSGSNAKLNPPESLVTSMRHLLDQQVQQFNFMTNELNPSLAYMRRAIRELLPLLEDNSEIGWFTYLRPDHMEAEDLSDLRSIGCRLVRYGVETGSQRLSDSMEKGYDIRTVSRVLRHAADADIMNHVNFMVGYPGETEEDAQRTIDFVDENHEVIHSVRINPFYLPPGTRLANEPSAYGIRLTEFRSGYWDFEMVNGERARKETVRERIERLTEALMKHGIGFAGVLPFETLNTLTQFATRDEGIEELRSRRGYLWENASPDWLKSKLGGYTMRGDWEDTIYKRGRNYNLDICTD